MAIAGFDLYGTSCCWLSYSRPVCSGKWLRPSIYMQRGWQWHGRSRLGLRTIL